jgi:glycerophosphoryl diester phosphodiesterase
MDVCFTKDKKLVVHHDSNLARTCGVSDDIECLEYEKLPNFLPKVALDFAFRLYIEQTEGLRIPLLEDIFK